jgi:hypothetical protein
MLSPRTRTLATVAVASAVFASGHDAHAADTRFSVEAGALHDSNLNRARGGNERSDQALFIEGAGTRGWPIGATSGVVGRVGLRLRAQRTYDALNQAALVGRLTWRWQPQPGFGRPMFEAAAYGEAFRHADSAIRDGALGGLQVGGSQHLTDRVRIAAHFAAEQRTAREGIVFDLRTWRAQASFDWRPTDRFTIYGSGAWVEGDHVIGLRSGVPAGYAPGWFGAMVADPAFDRGADRFNAYRVDARSVIAELGVNMPIDTRQSLDLSVLRVDTKAETGPTYGVWQVRGSWIVGF